MADIQDFNKFIKAQKNHKSMYPGDEEHGEKQINYKDNTRNNSNSPGPIGRK
ncbi:hypothetical protein [Aquibacillus salsiterrae]|uniref:Uncharacterized protein n=1 Tax=Aquibacillus salsiterrae TaxID=2950439 RepID=A0A9X3WG28_9BACI|nr:hypothetical protein [Aquibacillus salsiterrae]MDC3417690.1 hypothetical protein [Aquibacillus salsiterrae]